MPNQTFKIYTARSYAGELVDSGPRVTQTGILTSTEVDFGIALKRDISIDRGVALGAAAAVFGISLREYNLEASVRPSDGTTVYKQNESVSYMQQGFVFVLLEGAVAVAAGDLMRVDTVTGSFSRTAVGGNIVTTTNVYAEEAATAGEIVKVRIDRV